MNKGFTLLELLVVVGIMGLLGTASVGGYRQMQRGLEERRVVDNASRFLTLAAERAQIDRTMVVVYYWNELLRDDSNDEEGQVVVGHAIAVRPQGRITCLTQGYLIDEFGDFEQYDEDGNYELDSVQSHRYPIRMYRLDTPSDMSYTEVLPNPEASTAKALEKYYNSNPTAGTDGLETDEGGKGYLQLFGYVPQGGTSGWKVGSVYGFEFQSVELMPGYVFPGSVPTSISSPISTPQAIVFEPKTGKGVSLPSGSVAVRAVRQVAGGSYSTVPVGTAEVENK